MNRYEIATGDKIVKGASPSADEIIYIEAEQYIRNGNVASFYIGPEKNIHIADYFNPKYVKLCQRG